MVRTQVREPTTTTVDRRQYALLVAKFLAVWLFFLILLTATAFVMHIDWARPKVEEMMSEALNRHVRLGMLSWNLSFNGFSISTNRMLITAKDEEPFVKAGPSEIGVAFRPLLHGKLIIHHLSFRHPEVWAIKVAPGKWNFSDLLTAGPDIRFIQIDQGKFHIIDTSNQPVSAVWAPYLLDRVNLKFVWPRDKRNWPVHITLDIPKSNFKTHIALTMVGRGLLENWQDNKYKFDLTAENINPEDLGHLGYVLPPMQGLANIHFQGEGIIAQGLNAELQISAKALSIHSIGLGVIKIPNSESKLKLVFSKNEIKWHNLKTKIGNSEFDSIGILNGWQTKNPSYQAQILGKISDLKNLPQIQSLEISKRDSQKYLTTEVYAILAKLAGQDQVSGSANFDISIKGDKNHREIKADLAAQNIMAKDILESSSFKDMPFLQIIGLDPTSTLRGKVKVVNNHRVELPEADIVSNGATVHASGFVDNTTGESKLLLSSEGMDLSQVSRHIEESRNSNHRLNQLLKLPFNKALVLGGHIDMSGHLDESQGHSKIHLTSVLKEASIGLTDQSLSTSKITGNIVYDGNEVSLNHIQGNMGAGSFTLDGSIISTDRPYIDLTFHATNIELDNLDRALEMFRVDFPILSGHYLYGKVKDLHLSIKGSPKSPKIALTMLPDDLYYQPPGLSKPLRAVSGVITYDNDRLVLKDVSLVSKGNKLITNLAINKLSTSANLERLKIKTSGIDLSEVHFFLSSSLMPPALQKGYLDFINRYQISGARGRAYGDGLWQAKGNNDFDLDGVIGFSNAAIKVGPNALPVDHLSGILAASGKELLIQDLSGNIGRSTFTVNGHVTNYRSHQATWQNEVRAQVLPSELLKLIPGLTGPSNIKLMSSGPIAFKASMIGVPKSTTVIFNGQADESDGLHAETPFGSLFQPRGQKMVLDGSLTINGIISGKVQLNNSHIVIGDSILQTQGSYTWFAPESKKSPIIDFEVQSPNPLLATNLVGTIDPTIKLDGVTGNVQGKVHMHGPLNSLSAQGFLRFNNFSLPPVDLYNVSGTIDSKEFFIPNASTLPTAEQLGQSRAKLNITSASLGELTVKNILADIYAESSEETGGTPRVGLRSGTATLGDGKVDFSGWLDLSEHKMHAEASLSKVSAADIVNKLLQHPGEIMGTADGHLILDSQGTEYSELLRNLNGDGEFTLSNGKVARFGQLQAQLTKVNLLSQGLFGFNLNNLLQSVVPVRTGEYKDLLGLFKINQGVLYIDKLKFGGTDMRIRAAGVINLPLNTINLNVVGNLPRVTSSIIGGPFGEMSKEITIQKLLYVLTFHKLENLPAVPLLGDIASDRPRAFAFQLSSTLDKPSQMVHSIEKSFHWLPNHTNASAHPVPWTN